MRLSVLKKGIAILVPALVLALGLVLQIIEPTLIAEQRHRVYDIMQRTSPRAYNPDTSPVRIIDLDDESLRRLGQWPWPRTQVAELVDRLAASGTAAIAFDIVFAEPDRTSPAQVIPIWPSNPATDALRANIASLPDHDAILAAAIARSNVVAGFALTNGAEARLPIEKAGFAIAGEDARFFVLPYSGAVANLPILETAATGNGSFNVVPDQDGIVRRIPLLVVVGETLYPSLAAETLRVAQQASSYFVKTVGASGLDEFTTQIGVSEMRIGDFIALTDERGQVVLYDSGHVPARYVPAWKVFEPDFDASLVAGRIALIGTSAAGLKDLRATPLEKVVAGIEVNAQVIEQIVSGTFLRHLPWTIVAEVLFTALFGIALIFVVLRFGAVWGGLSAAAIIAIAIFGSWQVFVQARVLTAPLMPVAIFAAVYVTGAITSYLRAEGERRRVRDAFSHYMSPVLVARLANNPGQLKLGGEVREMSILFSDIRGFTSLSESLQDAPEELTSLVNRVFTKMTDRILECDGTIDKYMGDAVMAFWNAPLPDRNHALNACRAALSVVRGIDKLNPRLEAAAKEKGRPFLPIRIGVGINTGTCVVGNLGSDHRFSYSAIGDAVNLAARLEGQTKTYGVPILIGESTRAAAGDLATLELDLIRVKGRAEPSRVYGLLGDGRLRASDEFGVLLAAHDRMLAAYRAGDWKAARLALREARRASGTHPLRTLYAIYERRIRAYEASPPPPDWDGVYAARSK